MASPSRLHPAENRGLRELYASAQQLLERWPRLAGWLAGEEAEPVLRRGAEEARAMLAELSELTPRYGLFGSPAARGVGQVAGRVRRGVGDRFLERNQALRLALLDIRHTVNLLAYLGEVAAWRGDARAGDFCRRWAERLAGPEVDLREAVAALGRDPDRAILAVDPSRAGALARRTGTTIGALGEAVDRRLGPRRR